MSFLAFLLFCVEKMSAEDTNYSIRISDGKNSTFHEIKLHYK